MPSGHGEQYDFFLSRRGSVATRRQLHVAYCVLDILVTEIMLRCSRILSVIGELIPACMPEHVRMNREWKLTSLPRSSDHLPKSG